MDKERLYHIIDRDDSLTDSEKRDIYQGELEIEKDYNDWCK